MVLYEFSKTTRPDQDWGALCKADGRRCRVRNAWAAPLSALAHPRTPQAPGKPALFERSSLSVRPSFFSLRSQRHFHKSCSWNPNFQFCSS